MNINELHQGFLDGAVPEDQLYSFLTARFRYVAQLRIGDCSDAEEIVQESLVDVFEKLEGTEIETSFSAWAMRILDLNILHYFRTRGRRERLMEAYAERIPVSDSDRAMSLKQILLKCLKAIGEINNRYARVLNFCHLGFLPDEICQKLMIKKNNYYSLLSRARDMLETCLETGKVR
jgi:RNA polymerase sigma factor (sigma-70 family)